MTPWRRRMRLAGWVFLAILATLLSLAFWLVPVYLAWTEPPGTPTPVEQPYRWR